eukprot:6491651-Amphidinium_carterae.1
MPSAEGAAQRAPAADEAGAGRPLATIPEDSHEGSALTGEDDEDEESAISLASLYNIPEAAIADIQSALQPCRGMSGPSEESCIQVETSTMAEPAAGGLVPPATLEWPFTPAATQEILEGQTTLSPPELEFQAEQLRLLPWNTHDQRRVVLDMSEGISYYASRSAEGPPVHPAVETAAQRAFEAADAGAAPSQVYAVGEGIHTTEKRESIERSDDALTTSEMTENAAMVKKAMLEELQRWVHYKCFSITPRKQCRNIVDIRWVIRWKFEGQPPKRNIRARLTVRGFKDADAGHLLAHATTASRVTQRVLTSLAVQLHAAEPEKEWQLRALD